MIWDERILWYSVPALAGFGAVANGVANANAASLAVGSALLMAPFAAEISKGINGKLRRRFAEKAEKNLADLIGEKSNKNKDITFNINPGEGNKFEISANDLSTLVEFIRDFRRELKERKYNSVYTGRDFYILKEKTIFGVPYRIILNRVRVNSPQLTSYKELTEEERKKYADEKQLRLFYDTHRVIYDRLNGREK